MCRGEPREGRKEERMRKVRQTEKKRKMKAVDSERREREEGCKAGQK